MYFNLLSSTKKTMLLPSVIDAWIQIWLTKKRDPNFRSEGLIHLISNYTWIYGLWLWTWIDTCCPPPPARIRTKGAGDGFVTPSVPPCACPIAKQAMSTALAAWRLVWEENRGNGFFLGAMMDWSMDGLICVRALQPFGPMGQVVELRENPLFWAEILNS